MHHVQCNGTTQRHERCRYHGVVVNGVIASMYCEHHTRQAARPLWRTPCRFGRCHAQVSYFFCRPGVVFFCQTHQNVSSPIDPAAPTHPSRMLICHCASLRSTLTLLELMPCCPANLWVQMAHAPPPGYRGPPPPHYRRRPPQNECCAIQ